MNRLAFVLLLVIFFYLGHLLGITPIAADDEQVERLKAENSHLWDSYLEQCRSNTALLELLDSH